MPIVPCWSSWHVITTFESATISFSFTYYWTQCTFVSTCTPNIQCHSYCRFSVIIDIKIHFLLTTSFSQVVCETVSGLFLCESAMHARRPWPTAAKEWPDFDSLHGYVFLNCFVNISVQHGPYHSLWTYRTQTPTLSVNVGVYVGKWRREWGGRLWSVRPQAMIRTKIQCDIFKLVQNLKLNIY